MKSPNLLHKLCIRTYALAISQPPIWSTWQSIRSYLSIKCYFSTLNYIIFILRLIFCFIICKLCTYISFLALAKIDPFSNEKKCKENTGGYLSIPTSQIGPRYSSSGIVSPCSSIHSKISISLVSEGQQQRHSLTSLQKVSVTCAHS